MGSEKNFKYLDDLIHSGAKEIVLDSDIVLCDEEESEYLDGVELDVDDFVIDGNGHTIDAQCLTRIFCCTGKNITIRNITFKNGFSKHRGGAIHNYGKLRINDSEFIKNTAKEYGGAIYNDHGDLAIAGSTFTENSANWSGGTIYNSEAELCIDDCTFAENKTNHDGGAIYNYYGKFSVNDSKFSQNLSLTRGGAIENFFGKMSITDSQFSQNISQARGGAICNNGGKCSIINSALNANTAHKYGGAIYDDGGECTIVGSALNDNEASDGGAINHVEGNFKIFNCGILSNKSPNNIICTGDSLQIYNTNFKDNKSKCIILNDVKSNLSIINGEFIENDIDETVLYNNGKFCSIEKTVFEKNISNNSTNILNNGELKLISPKIKDGGKTILNQKYTLIKKSSPGLENTIFGDGKVENIEDIVPKGQNFDFGYLDMKIHERDSNELILEHDITFETYESDYYESGIVIDIDNLVIDGKGKTIDAADRSRIFIVTAKNVTLKNIIFKNGHSHKNYDNPLNNHGGAIKINRNSDVVIENCEFINNLSEDSAGVIHNEGRLNILGSIFTENAAEESGGAIYNYKGCCSIEGSTFVHNSAETRSGVIYNFIGYCNIADSTFAHNTAETRGGAIYNDNGNCSIGDSIFNDNRVKGMGGVVYGDGGDFCISGSKFDENAAQESGGAIYAEGKCNVVGSKFDGNMAQDSGGAICCDGECSIAGSTFAENVSNRDGGAVYGDGDCRIDDSTFTDNKVQSMGGAIYNNGECSILHSAFSRNKSENYRIMVEQYIIMMNAVSEVLL